MAVLKWVIIHGQGAEDGDSAVCIKNWTALIMCPEVKTVSWRT